MPEDKTLEELISQFGDPAELRVQLLKYLFRGFPNTTTLGILNPSTPTRSQVMGQWDVNLMATISPSSGEWISMGPQVTIYSGGTAIAGPVTLNHFMGDIWMGVAHGCFPLPSTAKFEVDFTKEENGQYVTQHKASTENIEDQ